MDAAMAYDSVRGRVRLFGGTDGTNRLSEPVGMDRTAARDDGNAPGRARHQRL
jgi:hypothetical protein